MSPSSDDSASRSRIFKRFLLLACLIGFITTGAAVFAMMSNRADAPAESVGYRRPLMPQLRTQFPDNALRREKLAWSDLSLSLSILGARDDISLSVGPDGMASVDSVSYNVGDLGSLKNALHAVARDRLREDTPDPSTARAADSWEKLLLSEPDDLIGIVPGRASSEYFEGARQAAMEGFYFQTFTSIGITDQLAVRSLVLEAIARARGGAIPADPLLDAFQAIAWGRPHLARAELTGDSSVVSTALAAWLRGDFAALPATGSRPQKLFGVLFRIFDDRHPPFTVLADELGLPESDAHSLRFFLESMADVSDQHVQSMRMLGLAAERARHIVTGDPTRPVPNNVSRETLGYWLSSASQAVSARHNAPDPLPQLLAESWLYMAGHLRLDFLWSRFGHQESCREETEWLASVLGDSFPLIPIWRARKYPLEKELCRARYEAAKNYWDDNARYSALNALSEVDSEASSAEVIAMEDARRAETFRDTNIRTIAHRRYDDEETEQIPEIRHEELERLLALDPSRPSHYSAGDDTLVLLGISRIPSSLLLRAELAYRVAWKEPLREENLEKASSILGPMIFQSSEPLRALLQYGQYQWNLAKYEKAKRAYREWLTRHPQQDLWRSHVLSEFGLLLFESGETAKGLILLEEGSQSGAYATMNRYAIALEAQGRTSEAEDLWRSCADRYPENGWYDLVAFLDRKGKSSDAADIVRKNLQGMTDGSTRGTFVNEMFGLDPERLAWIYQEGVWPVASAYDDANLAVCSLIMGEDYSKALRHLKAGDDAGRRLGTVLWFHSLLKLRIEGQKAAIAFLDRNRDLMVSGPSDRALEQVLLGNIDAVDAQTFVDCLPDGRYLPRLYLITSLLKQASGDGKSARLWLDRCVRTGAPLDYIQVLARREAKLPVGQYWWTIGPRAPYIKAQHIAANCDI